eukprot:GABV01000478.1.p2 GENE.GABV01000478.1~~GABV01000478.1.p2  ORF type:complete len:182 (+),score=79.07 GABV01000478.1:69-614(+)
MSKWSQLPEEDEFRSSIGQSLQHLTNHGSLDTTGHQVLQWIRFMEPTKFSNDLRLEAAQWIVMYHTVSAMTAKSEAEILALQRVVKPDYAQAWDLLDTEFTVEMQKITVEMIRLDIAQRLEDVDKLSSMFNLVAARAEANPQAALVAYTIAPMLGEWKQMKNCAPSSMTKASQENWKKWHK